jgi:TatA/E family protein of Tat protein translocase
MKEGGASSAPQEADVMIEGLFQPMHLLLILGIALLFFGPKRLPELGKGLGTSIRDFKDAMTGGPKPEEQQSQQQQAAPPVLAAPPMPHVYAPQGQQPQQAYAPQAPQQPYATQPPQQQAYAPQPQQPYAPPPPPPADGNPPHQG